MLRRFRLYRFVRTSLAIAAAIVRYGWLLARARIPGVRPAQTAWDRAHERTGRAIYRQATRLGGAYVKFGQILGSRGDVLPEALVAPLRGLHDRVPARPFSEMRRHVEGELKGRIEDVFAHVSEEPIAAASLAQVHRATLTDGEDVVLKVQYPEAQRLFPGDLGNMRRGVRAARLLNRRLDLRPLADELAEFVCLELDFSREAESTRRIATQFERDPSVRIPKVYAACSTSRLLVLEYLEGAKLTEPERLRERGVDMRALADKIASMYLEMIFEHGFFQGDPHPGNMLVLPDGHLALLDFGLAKELPPGFSDAVAALISAAMAGDEARVREAAHRAGFPVGDRAGDLAHVVRTLAGDRSGGPRRLFDALDGGALKGAPPHFALIVRALVILAGLLHRLAPEQPILQSAMARALAGVLARPAEGSAQAS